MTNTGQFSPSKSKTLIMILIDNYFLKNSLCQKRHDFCFFEFSRVPWHLQAGTTMSCLGLYRTSSHLVVLDISWIFSFRIQMSTNFSYTNVVREEAGSCKCSTYAWMKKKSDASHLIHIIIFFLKNLYSFIKVIIMQMWKGTNKSDGLKKENFNGVTKNLGNVECTT